MKRLTILLFLLTLPLVVSAAVSGDYTLYLGSGCQHCAKVEAYLEQNQPPAGVNIAKFDIYQDRSAAEQFNTVADRLAVAINDRAIPMLITPQNRAVIGDDDGSG